jgi:hypothetical protein
MASYFKMTIDFLKVAQILSGVVLKRHELREMRRADGVQVFGCPAPPRAQEQLYLGLRNRPQSVITLLLAETYSTPGSQIMWFHSHVIWF